MAVRVFAPLALGVLFACGDSEDVSSAPTLTEIRTTIFAGACTALCHSGGEFAAGGLDLTEDAHEALVEVPAVAAVCADSGMKRVVPGDPNASLLYSKIAAKIAGVEAPCGDGMPAGVDLPPIAIDDAIRIRRWILSGAKND